MQRIGFVGIGLMGQQMSRRLLAAGFPVTVWNRTKARAEELLAPARPGGIRLAPGGDVGCGDHHGHRFGRLRGGDLRAAGGVLEGAHPGVTLIDMGSIAPETSRSMAARARAKGVPMLDAPVTGNPKVASEGKLGIMVGGPRETFDACLPIFRGHGGEDHPRGRRTERGRRSN